MTSPSAFRSLASALALVVLVGCSGSQKQEPVAGGPSRDPRLEPGGDDAPLGRHEAQLCERSAYKEIELAGQSDAATAKRMHYDRALQWLRKARDVYVVELASEPDRYEDLHERWEPERPRPVTGQVPLGRQQALEREIDRLSREIERTTRDRPAFTGGACPEAQRR